MEFKIINPNSKGIDELLPPYITSYMEREIPVVIGVMEGIDLKGIAVFFKSNYRADRMSLGYFLIVPSVRRHGIGSSLLKYSINYLMRNHIKSITVRDVWSVEDKQSVEEHEIFTAFLEKNGFASSNISGYVLDYSRNNVDKDIFERLVDVADRIKEVKKIEQTNMTSLKIFAQESTKYNVIVDFRGADIEYSRLYVEHNQVKAAALFDDRKTEHVMLKTLTCIDKERQQNILPLLLASAYKRSKMEESGAFQIGMIIQDSNVYQGVIKSMGLPDNEYHMAEWFWGLK